jgi:hypothetical protein
MVVWAWVLSVWFWVALVFLVASVSLEKSSWEEVAAAVADLADKFLKLY